MTAGSGAYINMDPVPNTDSALTRSRMPLLDISFLIYTYISISLFSSSHKHFMGSVFVYYSMIKHCCGSRSFKFGSGSRSSFSRWWGSGSRLQFERFQISLGLFLETTSKYYRIDTLRWLDPDSFKPSLRNLLWGLYVPILISRLYVQASGSAASKYRESRFAVRSRWIALYCPLSS